jgi:hypothetical protein
VITVFTDVIGYDGAAIFQMDGVSPRAGKSKHPYKEDNDTQPHSGAF